MVLIKCLCRPFLEAERNLALAPHALRDSDAQGIIKAAAANAMTAYGIIGMNYTVRNSAFGSNSASAYSPAASLPAQI